MNEDIREGVCPYCGAGYWEPGMPVKRKNANNDRCCYYSCGTQFTMHGTYEQSITCKFYVTDQELGKLQSIIKKWHEARSTFKSHDAGCDTCDRLMRCNKGLLLYAAYHAAELELIRIGQILCNEPIGAKNG